MSTAIRETEWKYEVPSGAPLPDLRGLPGVAGQTEGGEVTLEATYHDTATFDLARAGITLRSRTGGSDPGWHLKVPLEPGTRTELRLPLSEGPPEEFVELLTARLRGRALRPVATITTRRHVTILADAQGQALAEVALDRVISENLGDGSALKRWDEVEVELVGGAAGGGRLLKAADRSLRRAGLTRADRGTKLEAALAGSLPEPRPAAQPPSPTSTSAGEVLTAYLSEQFEELLHQDLLVRRDEPDSVHRMRVAARRIRGVLQDFRRLLRTAQADELISELRWLGQELGRARDMEVLCDLLLAQLDRIPVESVIGPVQARIAGHYAPRTAAAEEQVRKTLASRRYTRLLDALEAFIARPPLVAGAEKPGAEVLPRFLDRARRRVDRRMRKAAAISPGIERDRALHDARKAAKRARYAGEAVSVVCGKRALKSAKAFKKVQSVLGEHHDAVIATGELRRLAVQAHGERENAFTYGLLYERLAIRAEVLEGRARHAWKRARRRKRTAWMR